MVTAFRTDGQYRGVGTNRTSQMFCHGYRKAPPEKTYTVTATIHSELAGCKIGIRNPFAKGTSRLSEMLPALQWAFFTSMTVHGTPAGLYTRGSRKRAGGSVLWDHSTKRGGVDASRGVATAAPGGQV